MLYDVDEVQRWLNAQTINGLDAPGRSKTSATPPDLETPRHRGRPKKEETVKAAKNASK